MKTSSASRKDFVRKGGTAQVENPNVFCLATWGAARLERWFGAHGLIEATRASAREHLEGAFARLERGLAASQVTWSVRAFNELRQLGDEIAIAYE